MRVSCFNCATRKHKTTEKESAKDMLSAMRAQLDFVFRQGETSDENVNVAVQRLMIRTPLSRGKANLHIKFFVP